MKFTLFRRDKNNKLHISTRTIEQVMARMTATAKQATYEVYPNVEMRRDSAGTPVPRVLNGVVVLTFGNLLDSGRREQVKETAMTLPTTLQAMSQFLLINLDEFNQIPATIQEGFLKNIIQLASVKIKRPYGRHVEDFPRLASFIATTNEHSVLADPSGNR